MISRFIAFALIINVAFGIFQCTNPTSFDPAGTVVSPMSNGYRVSLNSNGWVYCNPITVLPGGPTTTWATLLRSAGETGIGLNGATCTGSRTPIEAGVNPGLTGTLTGTAANPCPADFATVYTARPAGTTSSALLTDTLTVGDPIAFTVTQPDTAASNNVVGVAVTNQNTAPETITPVTAAGTAVDASGSAGQYAVSDLAYALYLQTTGSATVCFQNEGQFVTNPGECGEQLFVVGHTADSASVLSTSACIFVAFIAFILYN